MFRYILLTFSMVCMMYVVSGQVPQDYLRKQNDNKTEVKDPYAGKSAAQIAEDKERRKIEGGVSKVAQTVEEDMEMTRIANEEALTEKVAHSASNSDATSGINIKIDFGSLKKDIEHYMNQMTNTEFLVSDYNSFETVLMMIEENELTEELDRYNEEVGLEEMIYNYYNKNESGKLTIESRISKRRNNREEVALTEDERLEEMARMNAEHAELMEESKKQQVNEVNDPWAGLEDQDYYMYKNIEDPNEAKAAYMRDNGFDK